MSPPDRGAAKGPTPVEAIRHADKRANIPTEQTRDFVADDERAPKTVLYPRDPSLDPQLVWRGKDEQDQSDLAVPAVPIYIQEKIQPRVIIENLRQTARQGEPEPELTLFDDFNGIEFDDLVDFYQHEQNWTNRMILGDSLLVMTSLAEKERLRGKVQTVYLDPPYGIKFGSNWQVSTRKRDVKDGKFDDATRQPEQIRAFRDTWELGIHSYLSYLRDRLTVAYHLLNETGSVFVQIGDENVHLVRSLLDEVFGSENFVSLITFTKTSGATAEYLQAVSDYVVWYAKDRRRVKYRDVYEVKGFEGRVPSAYSRVELGDGNRRTATRSERAGELPDGGRLYALDNLTSPRIREARTGYYPIVWAGREFLPPTGEWKTNQDGMSRLLLAGRVEATSNRLGYVRYLDDFPAIKIGNVWTDTGMSFMADKVYVVQTTQKVIERCLLMSSDPSDLVLDPTCGSGTTAVAAEKWGRRWITIDTSRVALALTRTRWMGIRYPWFELQDGDVRRGFVCRTVPHVTLKSIAQNPDIKEGMTREEIDATIALHAEQELLVDQPYEDRKRVRVVGPFTVESLSPHRVLPSGDDVLPASEQTAASEGSFEATILENLRKAGVQNTVRQEHLDFEWLEPFAGTWISAHGEFTDADAQTRRAAVTIGPEYGTAGAEIVKEAAKEALKGAGFDLVLVCAFAFDGSAGETANEFQPAATEGGWAVAAQERKVGRLPVLLVRMNPDLAMGEDLLKKTGAGNLFMVFGEPDVDISSEDGNVVVEIRGVDVYDPTTGQVRSNTVDDIACWFIDTDYNEESFFVRHAYFTGAGDPYASLKRALRADIDEAAWASLYQTRSRPFDAPEHGKIAVKVINHYGDEVMKVYDVT